MSAGSEPQDDEATVTVTVPEMDCPSCVAAVESHLQSVKGVIETELQATTGTATVTYDPAVLDSEEIYAAIEDAGYQAVESEREAIAPATAVWTSRRAIRTWIGAGALAVGLAVAFVVPTLDESLRTFGWIGVSTADLALLAAVLSSGLPVIKSGFQSARARSLDIDLLMGTAIVAAMAVGLFIEAATLAVLYSIAELLEQYAMNRTRDSLRELLELAPNEATVLTDTGERRVPVDEVTVGDRVAVRPGEKIPVDGVVREGASTVDQSPITGESMPVDKTVGNEVYAGTFNTEGYLEIEATSVAAESTLAQIIELVREAQTGQTQKEQFVDRFASYYTPIVVAMAILTVLVPPIVIDGTVTVEAAGLTHTFVDDRVAWFVRGLTLLVIACPCAFVISTPVSVASGVTAAARHGVLIKGGNYLETMGEVDAIAIDKTGTLTKGELGVTEILTVGKHTKANVLERAAAVEQRSDHPIAVAIRERTDAVGLKPPDATAFHSLTGRGVRADIDGETHYVGKPALFVDQGIIDGPIPYPDGGTANPEQEKMADLLAAVRHLQEEGNTVVLVGTDTQLLGAIAIADEIRSDATTAIAALQEHDIEVVMLTGDNAGTAKAVAAELGIGRYQAELLPEQKVKTVQELKQEYGNVAMVGDGINDAPALARADVGIAMGAAGTDTAIDTANIALMSDELRKLPYLYRLSNQANTVIRQNIWSSLGVKLVLAVGVPFGYVSVALAVVVGDMGMSLGVTGNAMRLAQIVPDQSRE